MLFAALGKAEPLKSTAAPHTFDRDLERGQGWTDATKHIIYLLNAVDNYYKHT